MLFFVGGVLVLMGIIMLIKFLIALSRPKMDLSIKEYVFQKVKSDLFGFGGNQKHAKVIIHSNGQDHEALILVGKTVNMPVGENIKVSYNPAKPTEARYHNPKKELLMVSLMIIIGSAICVGSLMISNLISG